MKSINPAQVFHQFLGLYFETCWYSNALAAQIDLINK
jgi:hypothetical protein